MIKTFEEIRKEDVLLVGGKGANLGEMMAAGIAVPPGFVVTADSYRQFLNDNGLTEFFAQKLKEAGSNQEKLRTAAALFRTKILSGKLSANMVEEITNAYQYLAERCGSQPIRVAVRSSATAEDLPEASFAGQQETYLNAIDLFTVLRQIIHCYASLWGERAVSYRQIQGYDQSEVAIAVVIQEMVESEKAGVLFTANPVSFNPEEIQINASYGLGESVVSGHVTPDSYLCSKSGKVLQTIIGQKKTEILYSENGTKEVPVSEKRQKARALSDTDIQTLCTQAIRIEQHYGCPMDIEWAICGGKAFILQARAITTLNTKAFDSEEEVQIEQYLKGCKTSGIIKKNLAFLLEKIPDAFYPFDSDITALINDQKAIIFSKVGIVMSMQPQMDDDGIETLPPNGKKITKDIFKLGRTIRDLKNFNHCHQILEQQMQGFTKELAEIKALPIENMRLAECGHALEDIYDYVRRLTYSRFYYGMFSCYFVSGKCERAAKKISPSYTSFDLLQNLNNRAAEYARDMAALAEQVKQQSAIVKEIANGKDYASICSDFPEIVPAFQAFLKKHGYTSDFNCYCIHAKSFWEDPNRLIYILRPLLTMEKKEEGAEKHSMLMRQMRKKFGEKEYAALEQNIRHLRYFHVVREESQYMWETAFYVMRRVLARAALLSTGDRDYFHNLAYLFWKEVIAMCQRGELSAADKEKIERRKKKRPLAEKVWERAKLIVFSNHGDVLKGVSGSAGEAVGKVCIVNGPDEFYKLEKGDVLVCRLTDPEWTPLFTLASAVVADTGAALSHAAIVAREYGIPAVLGVGYATTKFHDGDTVRVDGTKGEAAKVG